MKSLMLKFFLMFYIVGIVMSAVIGFVAFQQLTKSTNLNMSKSMLGTVSLIEKQQPVLKDTDFLISEGTRHSQLYQNVLDSLRDVADSFGLKYVYLLKETDGKFQFIVSSEDNAQMPAEELFTYYDDSPKELMQAYETKEPVTTEKAYHDEYGSFVSIFYPIVEDDRVISIIGMDYEASGYFSNLKKSAITMVIALIATAILAFPVSFMVSRQLVKRINKLNSVLWRISEGDFDAKLKIEGEDEIAQLGTYFNKMIDSLKQHIKNLEMITVEKERMNNELFIASKIQSDMLPKVFPKFSFNKYVLIHATMESAKETSGDLYDFFYLDKHESKIVFVIADVSGKGVPASLFMVIAKMLIKQQMLYSDDPAQALLMVNKILCEENPQNMFITAIVCSLDLLTGKMTYANAGHNAPLISTQGKPYEFLKLEKGIPLGLFAESQYKNLSLRLEYSDKIYFYTDGMNEAMNRDGKIFGNARFLETANRFIDLEPDYFDDAVRKEIFNFSQTKNLSDDMTSISVLYMGSAKFKVSSFDQEIVLKTAVKELDKLLSWVGGFMKSAGYDGSLRNKINIVAEEIFVNIAHYAFDGKEDNKATVRLIANNERFVMRFEDGGKPFNPLEYEVCDFCNNATERKIGGLGIYITKKWMDEITYERKDDKNIVTVYKFIWR
ncbi:MAG: SpoIIE family protein phosphatase [Endomicrobia bacterium]|nr:SpoIIE family protein phosphatase [Endomicrobiia bacterium]MCL2799264.1 SpoIIE family protein phosphatase [Endomicrobiia bacterium]